MFQDRSLRFFIELNEYPSVSDFIGKFCDEANDNYPNSSVIVV